MDELSNDTSEERKYHKIDINIEETELKPTINHSKKTF